MPIIVPFILFRRFGNGILSQIVVNQLVRTEIRVPRFVGYVQDLIAFLSLLIRKSKIRRVGAGRLITLAFCTLVIWYPAGFSYPSPSGWECI